MAIKEDIMFFLSLKEEISLNDIYLNFPILKKETIRGTINLEVKKGNVERIKKGFYKIKK